MTNDKKEEIIAAMSSLLEQLVENEPPKSELKTAASKTVKMCLIKECTLERNKLNQNRSEYITKLLLN